MQINNEIHLTGPYRRLELTADADTIKPGHLVERTATGCRLQATSITFVERLFAQVDRLQGNDATVAYTSGEPVQVNAEEPGNLVMARLKAGFSYTIGEKLFPHGDGTLRPTTGSPVQAIAVVEATLDLTATHAVDTLNKVRVI